MAWNVINKGLNLMNTAYNGAGGIVISGDAVKGGYFVTDTLENIPSWSKVTGTLCFCLNDSKFYQYDGSSDTWQEIARFTYDNLVKAEIAIQGHLKIIEDGGHVDKPTNQTGFTSVDYTEYFNTGITMFGTNADGSGQWYRLSFPGISGTLSTIKYKHNIVLSGAVVGGPGGHAHCTFSFISDDSAAISSWERLCYALAVNFNNKVCPACGLFGYDNGGVNLLLITGISFRSNNLCFYGKQLASTTSAGVMTITSGSSADEGYWGNQISSSATITDTVEEC